MSARVTSPVWSTDLPRIDLGPVLARSSSDPIALIALAKAESNLRTYAPRMVGRCDWSFDLFQHSLCFVPSTLVPGLVGKDAYGWMTTPQNVQAVVNALCHDKYAAAAGSAGAKLDLYLTQAREVLGADADPNTVRLLALCRWNAPNLRRQNDPLTIQSITRAWLDPDLATWDPKHAANRANYQRALDWVQATVVIEQEETPVPDQNGKPIVGPGVVDAMARHGDTPKGDERPLLRDGDKVLWTLTPGEKNAYTYSAESNETYLVPKA